MNPFWFISENPILLLLPSFSNIYIYILIAIGFLACHMLAF